MRACKAYRSKYQAEKAACDAANQQRLAKMTEAERTQLKEAAREKKQQKKIRQRRKVIMCVVSYVVFLPEYIVAWKRVSLALEVKLWDRRTPRKPPDLLAFKWRAP